MIFESQTLKKAVPVKFDSKWVNEINNMMSSCQTKTDNGIISHDPSRQ